LKGAVFGWNKVEHPLKTVFFEPGHRFNIYIKKGNPARSAVFIGVTQFNFWLSHVGSPVKGNKK
jgi:hypothetical protein